MRLGDGADRRIDFVEAAILGTPEHRAPSLVQCIDGVISLLQPEPETLLRCCRITDDRVMTTVFIVDLPGGNRRMIAVAPGQQSDDTLRVAEVRRRREIVVPT